MVTRYLITPVIKKWDLFPSLNLGGLSCFNQQNMAETTLCCPSKLIINTQAASSRFWDKRTVCLAACRKSTLRRLVLDRPRVCSVVNQLSSAFQPQKC